jgi:glutathione S-transferase
MGHSTLVQFRSSHYNEKARWALDYKGIPHVRLTVLPGFHERPVRKLTGRTQVPVLIRDGEVIEDSTRIIAALEASHPSPPLYPEDPAARERALALEDFFDEQVGPAARHAMFFLGMPHTDFVAALFAGHRGALFRRGFAAMIALRRKQISQAMNLVPDAFAKSCEQIEAGWQRLEREISASGYLVGDRFSVADLAAASLLSILVFPDEFPHPPVIPPPAPLQEFLDSYTARPGAVWVREMYRKHRGHSAALSGV